MASLQLQDRTKAYALRTINVVKALPRDGVAEVVGRQLLRAGTSVGTNYRSARRGKSRADFINKLKIAEEECDESLYWMELLVEARLVSARRLQALMQEGGEILAMLVSSINTSRRSPG